MPVLVDIDQLLCLPEPLTPAKGFSCSRHTRPWRWRNLLHHFHGQLVVVGCDVGDGENRGKLVLCGGNFVVLGLGEDAELPQLLVQIAS